MVLSNNDDCVVVRSNEVKKQYACAGKQKRWKIRRGKMSPEFTNRRPDIPRVKA